MSEETLFAVILAAGLGTRMRSRRPKVLHHLAGRPMIDHVLDALGEVNPSRVVVVVAATQPEVQDHLRGRCRLAVQPEPRGTADALLSARPELEGATHLLVLNADSPLVEGPTLDQLVRRHLDSGAAASVLTVKDPSRPDGRVVRDASGGFSRVVEHRDADQAQRAIDEVNAGVYVFSVDGLWPAVTSVGADNRARERYLSEVLARLAPVEAVLSLDAESLVGVNDRVQLARAEAIWRRRALERLMLAGVTVKDPATVWLEVGVEVGPDTVIEPFTILRAGTRIGSDCRIGPMCDIGGCQIGDRVVVDHSWLRDSTIASDSDCGPFAKVRPGTEIASHVHVGSFAELVRSRIGRNTAVPHVSYLGDALVGEGVNIGAGTITANYDGVKKNPTVIEDGAFIGVDTMLRAPVTIGRGAKTGAGSVVTKDVPPGATAVGMPARALKRDRNGGQDR